MIIPNYLNESLLKQNKLMATIYIDIYIVINMHQTSYQNLNKTQSTAQNDLWELQFWIEKKIPKETLEPENECWMLRDMPLLMWACHICQITVNLLLNCLVIETPATEAPSHTTTYPTFGKQPLSYY